MEEKKFFNFVKGLNIDGKLYSEIYTENRGLIVKNKRSVRDNYLKIQIIS